MTDEQRKQLAKLWRCRFFPGSSDKKFVNTLANREFNLLPSEKSIELSEKQIKYLNDLTNKYRVQISKLL